MLDRTKPFEFRPTGYGVMDWPNLITYCEKEIKPKWYVADHDAPIRHDAFTELEMFLRYIR
jgi:hypothetical protein